MQLNSIFMEIKPTEFTACISFKCVLNSRYATSPPKKGLYAFQNLTHKFMMPAEHVLAYYDIINYPQNKGPLCF